MRGKCLSLIEFSEKARLAELQAKRASTLPPGVCPGESEPEDPAPGWYYYLRVLEQICSSTHGPVTTGTCQFTSRLLPLPAHDRVTNVRPRERVFPSGPGSSPGRGTSPTSTDTVSARWGMKGGRHGKRGQV